MLERIQMKEKIVNMTEKPKHLEPDTAAWWSSVMVEYDLEPHHMRLLTLAAEAFDAAQEAREVLVGEGKVYVDRFGQPKPRPEVSIQRDSAISFVGFWVLRELDLDVAVLQERNWPLALVSNRR